MIVCIDAIYQYKYWDILFLGTTMKTHFRNHHSINLWVLIGFQKLFVKRIVENVLCCVL